MFTNFSKISAYRYSDLRMVVMLHFNLIWRHWTVTRLVIVQDNSSHLVYPNITNFILFTKSARPLEIFLPQLVIDNIPINRVSSAKFLGVTIDQSLSWTEHISSISKTVSRNTGVLSKLRFFLPATSMHLLYNSLILPYLNYCNIGWAYTSNSKLNALFVIQKRTIRICTFSHFRVYAPLLLLTSINFKLAFLCSNILIISFLEHFPLSSRRFMKSMTRSRNNLFLPFTRTLYSSNTLRFTGPRFWNAISSNLRTMPSVGRFKISYKRVLLSHYVT